MPSCPSGKRLRGKPRGLFCGVPVRAGVPLHGTEILRCGSGSDTNEFRTSHCFGLLLLPVLLRLQARGPNPRMLFYLKKHVTLEVLATAVLGGVGLLGIRLLGVPISANVDWFLVVVWGCGGAFALTLWTLLLQRGYALVRGTRFAL